MEDRSVLLEVRGAVGYITLNRPGAANTIDLELARQLLDAATQCDENPDVRALVLQGAGNLFCAGGDLRAFAAQGEAMPRYLKDVTTYLHAAIARFARMAAPVVVAVHGSAAGAGMSLACAADFVVAAETARFTMAYTRVGLNPDGGSTYFLARIVGLRRALELTCTNRILTAAEARELGIVTIVVPADRVFLEATRMAEELAAGPTQAFAAAKKLFHAGWTNGLETQMELETRAIADTARTADAREGIAAFLEKRLPRWTGR